MIRNTKSSYVTRDQERPPAGKMNAFFIVPTSVKQSIGTLFMSHPPMEKRIEALNRLEAQLQSGGVAAVAA